MFQLENIESFDNGIGIFRSKQLLFLVTSTIINTLFSKLIEKSKVIYDRCAKLVEI